ncbi:hypothetical protein BJ508DRAFT_334945 [Ascobolus immersus RN42]|uniref:Uncharacterized protein n=1 Tax=Ascobolus immersus RN42 TaxID=1160509 RepID=A0A3N4HE94_ASCIM|nr:hypothetical protein BJ508DRAFT_334945 [Ascobolus immersus RN42]
MAACPFTSPASASTAPPQPEFPRTPSASTQNLPPLTPIWAPSSYRPYGSSTAIRQSPGSIHKTPNAAPSLEMAKAALAAAACRGSAKQLTDARKTFLKVSKQFSGSPKTTVSPKQKTPPTPTPSSSTARKKASKRRAKTVPLHESGQHSPLANDERPAKRQKKVDPATREAPDQLDQEEPKGGDETVLEPDAGGTVDQEGLVDSGESLVGVNTSGGEAAERQGLEYSGEQPVEEAAEQEELEEAAEQEELEEASEQEELEETEEAVGENADEDADEDVTNETVDQDDPDLQGNEERVEEEDIGDTVVEASGAYVEDLHTFFDDRKLAFEEVNVGTVYKGVIKLNPEDSSLYISQTNATHPVVVMSKIETSKQCTGFGCSTLGNKGYDSKLDPFTFCSAPKQNFPHRAYGYLPLNDTPRPGPWACKVPTTYGAMTGWVNVSYRTHMNWGPKTVYKPGLRKFLGPDGGAVEAGISKIARDYKREMEKAWWDAHDGAKGFQISKFKKRCYPLLDRYEDILTEIREGRNNGEYDSSDDDEDYDEKKKPTGKKSGASGGGNVSSGASGSGGGGVAGGDGKGAGDPSKGSGKGGGEAPAAAPDGKRGREEADFEHPVVPTNPQKRKSGPVTPSAVQAPLTLPPSGARPSRTFTDEYYYRMEKANGVPPKVTYDLYPMGLKELENIEPVDPAIWELICQQQANDEYHACIFGYQ